MERIAMGEGREGDWECSSCNNRNYAFRSFCNRCKQPRLLVDAKTPADSKWLPRAGDWICTGCTNNNYASREKCKKCGQLKEVAAMPATAMPGASFPPYSHYFASFQFPLGQKMDVGSLGELPLNSWSVGEFGNFGAQPGYAAWQFAANLKPGLPFQNPMNQLPLVLHGWRNGDWICRCGFHNYSSRSQCKKCNAFMSSMQSVLGMKRSASGDFADELDNKRLNAGQEAGSSSDSRSGVYASLPISGYQAAAALPGKGATQWRDGDWMCSNCNNHNYKFRTECNRCKSRKPDLLTVC